MLTVLHGYAQGLGVALQCLMRALWVTHAPDKAPELYYENTGESPCG